MVLIYPEFCFKFFFSENAFSELGSIGPPLTTNGSTQYLDHLSVNIPWYYTFMLVSHSFFFSSCTRSPYVSLPHMQVCDILYLLLTLMVSAKNSHYPKIRIHTHPDPNPLTTHTPKNTTYWAKHRRLCLSFSTPFSDASAQLVMRSGPKSFSKTRKLNRLKGL